MTQIILCEQKSESSPAKKQGGIHTKEHEIKVINSNKTNSVLTTEPPNKIPYFFAWVSRKVLNL